MLQTWRQHEIHLFEVVLYMGKRADREGFCQQFSSCTHQKLVDIDVTKNQLVDILMTAWIKVTHLILAQNKPCAATDTMFHLQEP